MTYEQTKTYLSILLDMEKNIYIQENILGNMYKEMNSLGIKGEYEHPIHQKSSPDFSDDMSTTGWGMGIIGGILSLIIFWANTGIHIFLGAFVLIGFGIVIGVVSGLIIGPIVACVKSSGRQKELDELYNEQIREFEQLLKDDKVRVQDENIIKGGIQRQIDGLEEKYRKSKKVLEGFYSYYILNEKYWHDIVAICTFYQYLCEKRTYCLEFDRKTGDKGAYNIYANELQLGVIISKLDLVLDKLDQIADNQNMLKSIMIDANKKVDNLSNNIVDMSRQINSSIQQQTAIEAYNGERTHAELSYRNTMDMIYRWN